LTAIPQLGLIDEIKQLREQAVRIYGTEQDIDHQEGIFQSIGTYLPFVVWARLTPRRVQGILAHPDGPPDARRSAVRAGAREDED
jgi:hypothetical protein